MKFCPTCETRYDEDILRFCMKDGTPLVDESEPKFIEMPSESLHPVDEDDPGDVTVVRKIRLPEPEQPPQSAIDEIDFEPREEQPPRIVVPMSQPEPPRARVVTVQPPPRRTNTAVVVLLTAFGTAALLAIGAGILWLFMDRGNNSANMNANVNVNANVFANNGINANVSNAFDFGNITLPPIDSNTNTNTRTPSPTPTPRPSVSPTPTPDETPEATPTPVRTPTPQRTPVPTPSPVIIRPGQPTPARPPARPTPREPSSPRD
jgi:hypothetical protein